MSHALYHPTAPDVSAPPSQVLNVGWHSRDQIHTFSGIGGNFSWPESPFVFARITFTPNPLVPTAPNFDPGQSGFYVITPFFGGFPIESGEYHTGVANFVVPPRMQLNPAGAPPPRDFALEGMFTDAAHTIQFMLVQGFTVPTPIFVPFRSP